MSFKLPKAFVCRLSYNLEQSGIFENNGRDHLVDIMQNISFHSRMVKQEPLKSGQDIVKTMNPVDLNRLLTFIFFLVLAKKIT